MQKTKMRILFRLHGMRQAAFVRLFGQTSTTSITTDMTGHFLFLAHFITEEIGYQELGKRGCKIARKDSSTWSHRVSVVWNSTYGSRETR